MRLDRVPGRAFARSPGPSPSFALDGSAAVHVLRSQWIAKVHARTPAPSRSTVAPYNRAVNQVPMPRSVFSATPPADRFPFIATDLRGLDDVIRERLHSEVGLIQTVAEYIIGAGGKRLRPTILCLLSRALRRDAAPDRHALLLAAVVEFIHTATLLHDDVVDESDLRRGRETANAAFGNAASVLVGDFLYSRAFQMMVEPGLMRVMQVLADATNTIAEGEVLQLLNVRDPDVDEERYLKVIRYKTARLFEAAAQLAAILCQVPASLELACAEYGGRLGTAFQLIDDVLDYEGTFLETGKRPGDDLREGKPTLPLIHVVRTGTLSQRNMVREALGAGGVDREHPDFPRILAAVRDSGALDYTRCQAQREAAAAREAACLLPEGEAQRALVALCDYALERRN